LDRLWNLLFGRPEPADSTRPVSHDSEGGPESPDRLSTRMWLVRTVSYSVDSPPSFGHGPAVHRTNATGQVDPSIKDFDILITNVANIIFSLLLLMGLGGRANAGMVMSLVLSVVILFFQMIMMKVPLRACGRAGGRGCV
jgi:hypothetical protein